MIRDADWASLDLGEHWAIAFWKDDLCFDVTSFDGFKFVDYAWENTKYLLDRIEEHIQEHRTFFIVEKAHHRVPTQWTQYKDVKRICEKYDIKLVEYKTSHIKKMVTGNGRADKEMIQRTVSVSEFVNGANPSNEHEYDAIACGICYLENIK